MTGVEILSSAEVVAESTFNGTAFWIGFIIMIGFVLTIGVIATAGGAYEKGLILFCLIVGIISGIFVGVMFGGLFQTPTSYETHYKVTIDDSVSMNEFIDKYEILDQEGKIYTVKERE